MFQASIKILVITSFFSFFFPFKILAQEFVANYNENEVPKYTLQDIFVTQQGKNIISVSEWEEIRRPKIIALFEEHVYGKTPANIKLKKFEVKKEIKGALGGLATLKEIDIQLCKGKDAPKMSMLLFIPNKQTGKVPVFLGLNFRGNHSIHPCKEISISASWIQNDEKCNITDNKATEESRGTRSFRWPVERILDRGYALATIYYGDIDPDFHDGFKNGIHPCYYKNGQSKPDPNEWGSIAAWAYGLSLGLNYLETDPAIDSKKVAVIGHSRLGKAALWAGATDPRFAMVISNNSGCGGAALSKRAFGETVGRITSSFPHWFCQNFAQYAENEDKLPLDQHMLLALVAPRPLYVASASDDQWADPRGEFLSAKLAGKVYKLYGKKPLPIEEMPPINRPVSTDVGYHLRYGKHNLSAYDWEMYLDFADKHTK